MDELSCPVFPFGWPFRRYKGQIDEFARAFYFLIFFELLVEVSHRPSGLIYWGPFLPPIVGILASLRIVN